MDTLKTCRTCQRELPTEEFYPHKHTRDRLQTECKRCWIERTRRNDDAHPGRSAARAKEWRSRDPEAVAAATKERARAWRQANPQKVCDAAARHKARKRDSQAEIITPEQYELVLMQHGNCCAYCEGEFAEWDHFIPLSRGGAHEIGNLVPACKRCNRSKGAKLPFIEWEPSGFRT